MPLEGGSPLTVQFWGNAVSEIVIDESKTQWNFDELSDADAVDATTRAATFEYEAPAGQTRTFVARLRMFDIEGNMGEARVAIRVEGPPLPDDQVPVGGANVRIIVGIPNSPSTDISQGTSPLSIMASVDATGLTGTVQSIIWDMGDGTQQTGLAVPHTYINETGATLRFPITATVTTVTGTGSTLSTSTTRLITVFPGSPLPDVGQPHLPGAGVPGSGGGSPLPCGAMGVIPLFTCVLSLTMMRRRGFRSH